MPVTLPRTTTRCLAGSEATDRMVTAGIADKLLAENQADEQYRPALVWFCFFRPGIAGEGGIG